MAARAQSFFMNTPAAPPDLRNWWGGRANADVAGPLLLAGPFNTADKAADEARRRISIVATEAESWSGAARRAAADWIDRHWPIIEQCGPHKPDVTIFPEFVQSARDEMVQKWSHTALKALVPLRPGATPAEKVLHKGVAPFPSLRYIGPQMRKANLQNEGPAAPVLRDICRSQCLELHKAPTFNLKERQLRWKMNPKTAVLKHFNGAKSTELQKAIVNFMLVLSQANCLLFHLWHWSAPELCTVSLRAIFERVLKPHTRKVRAKRKRDTPALGFGIEYDGALPEGIRATPGHPMPSAKRVRAKLIATPQLVAAVIRQSSFTAAVAHVDGRLNKNFWIPFCKNCGWRKRPVGATSKKIGFVIDVQSDKVTCETCAEIAPVLNIKNYQILTVSGWSRLCNRCGAFTSKFQLRGLGAICTKCASI